MKTDTNVMTQNRNIVLIALATGLILLVPLLAMQLTDEVSWNLADFAVAGALLFGTGLTFEVAMRKVRTIKHRAVIGVAVVLALLVVWIELAVGIFGTPAAGS